MIKTFSVAQSKEVSISSPLHKVSFKEGVGLMSEREEMELTQVLVESVYYNHRRSQFGRLPPDQCRLCVYGNGGCGVSIIPLIRIRVTYPIVCNSYDPSAHSQTTSLMCVSVT